MRTFLVSLLSVVEDIAVLACGVCFFGGLASEVDNPWWKGLFVSLGVAVIASAVLLRWPSMVMRAALAKARKGSGG